MLKATHFGLAACLITGPLAIAQLSSEPQGASPLVTDFCPQATWTQGYRIGEIVPLNPQQYRSATVIAVTPLRSSYGFEGDVITNLPVGTQVTIMGEVWDVGCNQWMAVFGDQQISFIHGNALQNLPPSALKTE